MANILMVNLPYTGHTKPTLPLAKALITRGHEVTYVNAKEYQAAIEATGAKFVAYQNYPDNPSLAVQNRKCFKAAYNTCMNLEQDFDLLIYEMFFYPGLKLAKELKIPAVRQFSQPAWSKEVYQKKSKFFHLYAYLIDKKMMSKKNKQEIGLPNHSLSQALLTDKPDLNIVYVPKFFQENLTAFGKDYLFCQPDYEKEETGGKTIPYDTMTKPIVYISLGSLINNKNFYKKCLKAFEGKNMSIILNTGKINPQTLGKLPKNIHAYSFVPQVEVLKHSDIFITHCGMNSVNEAMAKGVPMLCLPIVNDQKENAKKVVELGLGESLKFIGVKPKTLSGTVEIILNNETIKQKSQEVKMKLEEKDSFDEAIMQVEALISAKIKAGDYL